jgi:hypothetical protein
LPWKTGPWNAADHRIRVYYVAGQIRQGPRHDDIGTVASVPVLAQRILVERSPIVVVQRINHDLPAGCRHKPRVG